MTRQQKTPRQRAEEQLAVAERFVERLDRKRTALADELQVVEDEYADAVRRRDHARKHPDLAPTPGTNTTTTPAGDNA